MTFGSKKFQTPSTQYLLKLLINQTKVPTVKNGKSIKYIGQIFKFSMNNMDHKSKVLELVANVMIKVDKIPCHLRNKLPLSTSFVISKIVWHFAIAAIGKTWVTENIDNLLPQYIDDVSIQVIIVHPRIQTSKTDSGKTDCLYAPAYIRARQTVCTCAHRQAKQTVCTRAHTDRQNSLSICVCIETGKTDCLYAPAYR